MDQIITFKTPKLGPDNNTTAYIYIYIYICAVELKAGPRFGVSCVKNRSKSSVKIFLPPFLLCFLGMFKNTNSVTLCQNSVFFCKILGMSKMWFSTRKLHFCFSFLCWRNRNKKRKWKRPENPIKNSFFLGGHPKM